MPNSHDDMFGETTNAVLALYGIPEPPVWIDPDTVTGVLRAEALRLRNGGSVETKPINFWDGMHGVPFRIHVDGSTIASTVQRFSRSIEEQLAFDFLDTPREQPLAGDARTFILEQAAALHLAVQDRERMQHAIDCANTPMMRDVLQERSEAKNRVRVLTRALQRIARDKLSYSLMVEVAEDALVNPDGR